MNGSITTQEEILWQYEVDDYVRQVHFAFLELLCATSGGQIHRFSKDGSSKTSEMQLHHGAILSSDVAHAAPLLATGGEDGRFLLTHLGSGNSLFELEARGKWVEHVAFSPDGKWIAFAAGKEVRIISAKGELYCIIEQPTNTVSALSWHSSSVTLAIGFFGGVCLYNLIQKKVYQYLPWQNAVVSLTISANKKWVCSGTQDCQVHIWPLPYKEETDLAMQGFPNKVKYLHWHHNGRVLATNSGEFVVLWDFGGSGPSGKQPDILKGHKAFVSALAFQHSGDLLASGDDNGMLIFFKPSASGLSDSIVKLDEGITSIAWSSNDKMVAVGTAGGELLMVKCPLE